MARLFRFLFPKGVSVSTTLGSGFDQNEWEDEKRRKVVEYAKKQEGKPYVFGIENDNDPNPENWDCSELSSEAYKRSGLKLPDGSWVQYEFCRPVIRPKPGDLGFLWSEKYKRVGHVEIYVGSGFVIGAVGGRGVRIASSDWLENHERFNGWRRHPEFKRGGDRPS